MFPQKISIPSYVDDSLALKSVHIEGCLKDLLLNASIEQRYLNETNDNLEIVYTFPLAWGAILMGLDVSIAGKKLSAIVKEKTKASKDYERAIEDGDSPVMVEQSSSGLVTANLGNIKPGEEVVATIRYSQLMRFNQGQLRLNIPTVIANKYGDPYQSGELAAHHSADSSFEAQYPLTLNLELSGQIINARLSSPSHRLETQRRDEVLTVTLAQGAKLNGDVVILLDDIKGTSFAFSGSDGDEFVQLASFCPQMISTNGPISLKILLDCSGSMTGERIIKAKEALNQILDRLNHDDYISFSRFGSSVQHVLKKMLPVTTKTIRKLAVAIEDTYSDMGGTEIESALIQTMENISPPDTNTMTDLLLITDGEVWNGASIVAACQKYRSRIFAIGVGIAPGETLLRELVETTGGACELVSNLEDATNAILRIFNKIRGTLAADIKVEWPQKPLWQTQLPKNIYNGETIHLMAGFSQKPETSPKLFWTVDDTTTTDNPETLGWTDSQDLGRLGGFLRIKMSKDQKQALDLALKYQLVTDQSNLILVYDRGVDKAIGMPILSRSPQMIEDDHSLLLTLGTCLKRSSNLVLCERKSFLREEDDFYLADYAGDIMEDRVGFDINPQITRKMEKEALKKLRNQKRLSKLFLLPDQVVEEITGLTGITRNGTPLILLKSINSQLSLDQQDFAEIIAHIQNDPQISWLNIYMDKISIPTILTAEFIWKIFLCWLIKQLPDTFKPNRKFSALLKADQSNVDQDKIQLLDEIFSAIFPQISSDSWVK